MNGMKSKHHFSIPAELGSKEMSAVERHFIAHCCLKKIKFRRLSEAKTRIFLLQIKDPWRHYGFYKCNFCGGYHVTSHANKTDIDVKQGSSHVRWRKRKILLLREEYRQLGILGEVVSVGD